MWDLGGIYGTGEGNTTMVKEWVWEYPKGSRPILEVVFRNTLGIEFKRKVLVDTGFSGFAALDLKSFEALEEHEGLELISLGTMHCVHCVCDRCRPDLSDAERDNLISTLANGWKLDPIYEKSGKYYVRIVKKSEEDNH